MRTRTPDRSRSRSVRRRAAVALAAAVAAPALAWPVVASAQTWTANVSGSWSTASNWTSLPASNPSTQLLFTAQNADSYDALDDIPGVFDLQSLSFVGTSAGSLSASTGSLSVLR